HETRAVHLVVVPAGYAILSHRGDTLSGKSFVFSPFIYEPVYHMTFHFLCTEGKYPDILRMLNNYSVCREESQMQSGHRSFASHSTHPLHMTGMYVGLALIAVYVIWGSTYLAVGIALESFPPLLLSSYRFLLAGGLLYLILRIRGVPTPSARQWVWATIMGALFFGVCQGGVAFAQQWVSSSFAAIGISTIPLWTTLFLGIWRKWPKRQEWFGLLIGFAGVLLLNVGGAFHASPLGAALVFVAAASWGLG